MRYAYTSSYNDKQFAPQFRRNAKYALLGSVRHSCIPHATVSEYTFLQRKARAEADA